MTDGPFEPTLARAAGLEARYRFGQPLRSVRSPSDVSERGLVTLCQLDAVVEALAPAAQVDRPPVPSRLLESENIDKEAAHLVELRGAELNMGEL